MKSEHKIISKFCGSTKWETQRLEKCLGLRGVHEAEGKDLAQTSTLAHKEIQSWRCVAYLGWHVAWDELEVRKIRTASLFRCKS